MAEFEKQRPSFRFSVADLVLILLAIACVIGILLRFNVVGKLLDRSQTEKYNVAFKVEGITQTEADRFVKGTEFFADGKSFGTLSSADSVRQTVYVENASGVLISYESEELLETNGIFECELARSDYGYLFESGGFIAPGSEFTVYADGISAKILITGITAQTD